MHCTNKNLEFCQLLENTQLGHKCLLKHYSHGENKKSDLDCQTSACPPSENFPFPTRIGSICEHAIIVIIHCTPVKVQDFSFILNRACKQGHGLKFQKSREN